MLLRHQQTDHVDEVSRRGTLELGLAHHLFEGQYFCLCSKSLRNAEMRA